MIWVCLYLLEQAGYSEVISAVPVQQLPHECAVSGFPLVLDDLVLGCDRTGVPNQFGTSFETKSLCFLLRVGRRVMIFLPLAGVVACGTDASRLASAETEGIG